MRISDWSSDVCSSDLQPRHRPARRRPDLVGGHWPLPTGPTADHAGGRHRRRLAVLCAAPVRGHLLGPERRLDGRRGGAARQLPLSRSEEHTSELQSLMRISYAVFCLKKKKQKYTTSTIELLTKNNNSKMKHH